MCDATGDVVASLARADRLGSVSCGSCVFRFRRWRASDVNSVGSEVCSCSLFGGSGNRAECSGSNNGLLRKSAVIENERALRSPDSEADDVSKGRL